MYRQVGSTRSRLQWAETWTFYQNPGDGSRQRKAGGRTFRGCCWAEHSQIHQIQYTAEITTAATYSDVRAKPGRTGESPISELTCHGICPSVRLYLVRPGPAGRSLISNELNDILSVKSKFQPSLLTPRCSQNSEIRRPNLDRLIIGIGGCVQCGFKGELGLKKDLGSIFLLKVI